MVQGVPPLPRACTFIEKTAEWADIIICSGTPTETLMQEWCEHGLDCHPRIIAGQEAGKKADQLRLVANGYPAGNVIMIGDSPGDLSAARANGIPFFPVNPGREETSWDVLCDEVIDRFRAGYYTTEAAEAYIAEFNALLPIEPPWRMVGDTA